MNNIEILEHFCEMEDYKNKEEFIQALENLILENKKMKNKINKIKELCDTKPYVAYTLYGDLLHESDEILKIIGE